MNEKTLIIGGCRSGKSSHALELADRLNADRKIFIATAVGFDREMKQRIKHHQEERSPSWSTVEAPDDLPKALTRYGGQADVLLVDCLTLWINNLLLTTDDQDVLAENIRQLTEALAATSCPVIVVTNEVGSGIVPENKLARLFRDTAGLVNRKTAQQADTVIWMAAGIPVKIK